MVAAKVSTLAGVPLSRLDTTTQLFALMTEWGRGPPSPIRAPSAHYSSAWLNLHPRHPQTWKSIYNMCRRDPPLDQFELAFTLCPAAFSSPTMHSLASTFIAFATDPTFLDIPPPSTMSFDFVAGFQPNQSTLIERAIGYSISLAASRFNQLPAYDHETLPVTRARRQGAFDEACRAQATEFAAKLIQQWPCSAPITPPLPVNGRLFDVAPAMIEISAIFNQCFNNCAVRQHVNEVQTALNTHRPSSRPPPPYPVAYTFNAAPTTLPSGLCLVQNVELFDTRHPKLDALGSLPKFIIESEITSVSHGAERLAVFISELQQSKDNSLTRLYTKDLKASLDALIADGEPSLDHPLISIEMLLQHHDLCKTHRIQTECAIRHSLSPSGTHTTTYTPENALREALLWPQDSTWELLGQLSSLPLREQHPVWQEAFILLAQSILAVQRAERLIRLLHYNKYIELAKELSNDVPTDMEVKDRDWLLIQVCLFRLP